MNISRKNVAYHPSYKKHFGQHFLREQSIADEAVALAYLGNNESVIEIGCGDGFLTKTILKKAVQSLSVYEVDPDWAAYVKKTIKDDRLTIVQNDVLKVDWQALAHNKPWVMISNLPYNITFPILFNVIKYRDCFSRAVVMVQEEVAQKILKRSGRGYGFISLYFQYYFDIKEGSKISPQAFDPEPKIFSRLLLLQPREKLIAIPRQEESWKFVKVCFLQPRRILKNNLITYHYAWQKISEETLSLRAQQMTFSDFLKVWNIIHEV